VRQNARHVVREDDRDVAIVEQGDRVVHGLELVGDDLDLALRHAAGAQPVAYEARDLAGLAPTQVGVFLDDHVIEAGGQTPQLPDVLVATVARGGDDTNTPARVDAYTSALFPPTPPGVSRE
jgi:hypothetical protein